LKQLGVLVLRLNSFQRRGVVTTFERRYSNTRAKPRHGWRRHTPLSHYFLSHKGLRDWRPRQLACRGWPFRRPGGAVGPGRRTSWASLTIWLAGVIWTG